MAATIAVAAVVAASAAGCRRPLPPHNYFATQTGTCSGVCSHYLECKGVPTEDPSFVDCLAECQAIFEDPVVLGSIEQLECTDAILFVEGRSGRGPGQTATPAQSRAAH